MTRRPEITPQDNWALVTIVLLALGLYLLCSYVHSRPSIPAEYNPPAAQGTFETDQHPAR